MQHNYQHNHGYTTKRILSEESETTQIPLLELECFWREIFTAPSAEDTRTPTPTQWGMVAPITHDEVLTALKGMKDGAPGLDDRKLRDLKGIPVNLWLLAGYQPAALKQGETILIPKVEGTHDPAQH